MLPCSRECSAQGQRYCGSGIPVDTPAFTESLRLVDASGAPVALAAVEGDYGLVLLCPLGGLEPDADYTWSLDPVEDKSTNQAAVPGFGLMGSWTFHTADAAQWPLIATEDDCMVEPSTAYFDRFACFSSDTGAN